MNKIFWNVDTQKDFMLSVGKLYINDAETIIPNLSKLTLHAINNGITIINTADLHTKESKELSETPDFINTFPNHCMEGTSGAELIEEVYPKKLIRELYVIYYKDIYLNENNLPCKNIIIYKDNFDVFKGNPLTDKLLDIIKPEEIIVYGVALDVCVNFAIIGLTKRGYKVKVVVDAIKELPNISNDDIYNIFNDWKNLGVELRTTEQIIKEGEE